MQFRHGSGDDSRSDGFAGRNDGLSRARVYTYFAQPTQHLDYFTQFVAENRLGDLPDPINTTAGVNGFQGR
jgi:hypothetical protein